ncbi:GntR family transcriptional regulator [Burkholderia arboris]|uniref:GntR family transcriptional regulator n=1 Tax=Burkholderia arboris TaxID=488730 RepID=UPI00210B8138|nr:GntR family transcriptional regulator [Burkholderia arboris]UTV59773.1 GntR family transcriptional regulator [Burkholderia arboris]
MNDKKVAEIRDLPASERGVAKADRPGLLEPVERETLYDKVYRQLSQALRQGQFEMGQSLTLRYLAGTLGVSMMPVRDAVSRLVSEGALETLPNRQVRVPLLTLGQYQALIEARVAAEGYAAYLSAKRIGGDALRDVKAANTRLKAAAKKRDHPTVMEANQAFHFGIYRGADSPALLQIIENLWQQSGPYLSSIERAMTASPAKRGHDFGAAQHDRIIAALESGDGDTARATLVEDIETFGAIYLDILRHDHA